MAESCTKQAPPAVCGRRRTEAFRGWWWTVLALAILLAGPAALASAAEASGGPDRPSAPVTREAGTRVGRVERPAEATPHSHPLGPAPTQPPASGSASSLPGRSGSPPRHATGAHGGSPPAPGATSPSAPVAPPAPTSTSTSTTTPTAPYAFWRLGTDGEPVRWNPCHPIRYATNLRAGPPFAAAELAEAVRQVRVATGLDLVHVGDTDATSRRDAPGDVLVALLTEEQFPFGSPTASGYGQAFSEAADDGGAWYRSGIVVIRPDHGWTQGVASANPLVTMFMHELGHVAGLAHVDSSAEIMGTGGNGTARGWGRGDQEGLRRVGVAAGC